MFSYLFFLALVKPAKLQAFLLLHSLYRLCRLCKNGAELLGGEGKRRNGWRGAQELGHDSKMGRRGERERRVTHKRHSYSLRMSVKKSEYSEFRAPLLHETR